MNFKKYLDKNIPSYQGKNIVITGANSGIGFSGAMQFAYKKANIYLACRNQKRAFDAMDRIKKEVNDANLEFLEYDQSDFASIENFVNNLSKINIDVLILNAGVYRPKTNEKTKNGFSLTVGTNYIGLFYLVNRLDRLIRNGKIKQIIFVSSIGRWFTTKKYLSFLNNDSNKLSKEYFASKRMVYHFAGLVKEKYNYLNVDIMHPGIALTRIVDNQLNSLPNFLNKFGNLVMKIFANTSEKSSLAFLISVKNATNEHIGYSYPRGLFHISGLPGYKLLDYEKIKSDQLLTASNKLFI